MFTLTILASPAQATHVGCGSVITQSTTLDSDIGPCPGDGLVVTASNITLDLNGHRIFAANGPGDNAGIRLVLVNGVTVRNGTVEGFDAGVVIMGVAGEPVGGGNTVRNMTVQNNIHTAGECDLGDGIAILNSDDNRILDNRVVNNGPYGGISLIEDSDRNLIRGNVVLDHDFGGCGPNSNQGIRIEGPGANDNRVENNLVEGGGLAGIGLHDYICSDVFGDEVQEPNSGNVIVKNTVRFTTEGAGIHFLQVGPPPAVCTSWGNTIERNTSTDNQGDGIFVAAGSHDNVISHNVVNNNSLSGIHLSDPLFRNEFTNVGPTTLDLVSPDRPPYVEGVDYRVMTGSGSGDVTATLRPIDITFTDVGGANTNPVDTSTSGCQQADYDAAGFQAGDVALIQRGTCTFVSKVNLAIANGASAVVMFNEGQAPNRTTFAFGSVGPVPIPVISTTYGAGVEMYNLTQTGPVVIHVVTNTTNEQIQVSPAPYDNVLIANRGRGNGEFDGYDGNLEPPCDNNKWRASRFVTVNQPCVVGPGGSGTAVGRTGEGPGRSADAPGHQDGGGSLNNRGNGTPPT